MFIIIDSSGAWKNIYIIRQPLFGFDPLGLGDGGGGVEDWCGYWEVEVGIGVDEDFIENIETMFFHRWNIYFHGKGKANSNYGFKQIYIKGLFGETIFVHQVCI